MRRTRFDLWFATTALVAVAAGLSLPAHSAPITEQEISAAVPTVEPAHVSSPGSTDVPRQPSAAAPAAASIQAIAPDSPPAASPPEGGQRDVATPAKSPVAAPVEVAAPPKAPPATPAVETATPAAAPAVETAAPATPPGPAEAAAPAAAAPAVAPPAANTAPQTPPGATTKATPPESPAVAEPAAPATPAAPAAAAVEAPVLTLDQQVAEKVHELFGGRVDRIIGKANKAAVEAFYTARNFAPLWVENGAQTDRAKAAVAYLAGVAADGLDPSDYPVPSFTSSDPDALAEAELKFTATVLTYARHAQIGRVHYSRVSSDIVYNLVAPEAGAVLTSLAQTSDIAGVLDSFNPPQAGYKALKAKLAEIRNRNGEPARARIASGKTLKVGMDDPRVPQLRERFDVAGDSASTTYDKALSDAVKGFQRKHELRATGFLTPATVEALNGPRRHRDADIIIANMERWRWLPRDLGDAYVMVNIPDYTLRVMDHGKMVWTTKIVAGKPGEKATPLLSETMKYITVNPTWNVPPSIIHNEYLPALAQDPTVLDRMGLRLEHNRDGSIRIYQPPGDGNALGRIRFNFPNKFLVYQHDTPDKYLFAKDKRAYSHGCMRVQYPDKYAEVLLNISNPKDGFTAEKIRRMYGNGERDIRLNTPIPVHLTYQTAFVDDAGHLAFREDVYGRDARLLAALKGEDRRVADIPVERRETSVPTRRQASRLAPSQTVPQPFSFFGNLFR